MSNKIKTDKNQTKLLGILVAIISVLVVMSILINASGAWFTDNDTHQKQSATPVVTTHILDASNSNAQITNEIELTASKNVTIKVDANVNVYLRARYALYAYTIENQGTENEHEVVLATDNDPIDYFTVAYNTTNVWKTGLNSLNAQHYYYCTTGTTNLNLLTTASQAGNTMTVNFLTITRTATAIPSGVHVKLQVFAEAVQGNSAGLAKWA